MSTIPPSPFVLIDGSSYLFRAYHALPPFTNSKGQPTGAIYGVVNMLKKIMTEYSPQKMAVVFDSKEKNFRHALYEPYKANRTVMPDELQTQIAPLHALIQAMGIPLIIIPGIEADDIIGTLAKQAKQKGLFTLISTGDKDFTQLVSDDHIILINTMSNTIYNREKVIEKFEVPPESMVDYLSLIGDSVDNVPGIPNVGPKTAVKWLKAYHTLDNIIAHADEITGKVGENLRANLGVLPLYKELVTIKTDMDIAISPENTPEYFELKQPDLTRLRNLYTELEFKSWLQMLNKMPITPEFSAVETVEINEQITKDYQIILSIEQLNTWVPKLKNSSILAISTKTSTANYISASIVGIAFAIQAQEAIYIPFGHDYMDAPSQLESRVVLEALKPLLEDSNLLKIGHNIKYDIEVLANHEINLKGIAFDTMLESYIVHSTSGQHTLDALAQRILKYSATSYENIAGKGVKEIAFNQIPIETAGAYATEEVDLILQVHQLLWKTLESLPKQKNVFQTIEMPLVPVLARMERHGVLIDPARLAQQSVELQHRMQAVEQEVFSLADEMFNLNSPKQLQEILFSKLKYPVLEKTPSGQASTSEPVLQELALNYPVAALILEYRSLSKLKSTYTDALPAQINPQTGRVHTSYQQAVTSTGRLSSTDPNLQNIPIRGNEGRRIRSAFIAPRGKKIVAADYSQIELRIMAHLSQDKGLQEAFEQEIDIHNMTAAGVFNVPLEAVSDEQRRQSKAINFGLMYGMSVFGLAKQLGVSQEEAKKTVDNYFNYFPGVKQFMDKTRQEAFESGYVETVTGRRLYLPDVKSPKMNIRKAAERAAINAPMQGTNADIIKLAMIQIDELIHEKKWDMHMIMQVHDELVFEVSETILPVAIAKIKEIMENVIKLSVKLHVNIGVADNWEAAH